MSHRNPTYVIFDGDEDKWAYGFMLGWKTNDRIEFDFSNAHDLDNMTSLAQDEAYVKAKLRDRMRRSSSVLVLVGQKTKNLYKFVRWELDLALELGLPIIVVNLNNKRQIDRDLCPPIIRELCALHIPFRPNAIKHALDYWPMQFQSLTLLARAAGPREYSTEQYRIFEL